MLPTDSKIRFDVCESVREERHNKLSLMGLFPDGVIRLPADTQFPAAFPLAFIYVLLDGEGPFVGDVIIKSAAPHQDFNGALPNVEKKLNEAGIITLSFTPFIAFAFGAHEVTLTLEQKQTKQSYVRGFEIKPI